MGILLSKMDKPARGEPDRCCLKSGHVAALKLSEEDWAVMKLAAFALPFEP
jgi:hypothetical protein